MKATNTFPWTEGTAERDQGYPSERISDDRKLHSHPESPSRPSEEDKRLAFDPNIEYLILSLMDAENPVLKAFGVDKEKNVTVHELQITE